MKSLRPGRRREASVTDYLEEARRVQEDRDRAVVDRRDLHHGSEGPRLDMRPEPADRIDETLVQRASEFGRSRVNEGRAPPVPSVAEQGELRDDEELACYDGERAIHRSRVIPKDAQVDDLFREGFRVGLGVLARDPEQDEESHADACDARIVDVDARRTNARYDGAHALADRPPRSGERAYGVPRERPDRAAKRAAGDVERV